MSACPYEALAAQLRAEADALFAQLNCDMCDRHSPCGECQERDAVICAKRDAATRLDEARAVDARLEWDDRPLPEDAAIDAAFPTRSAHPAKHELYAEAMRLVGDCYSKARLVALVNWLLHRDTCRDCRACLRHSKRPEETCAGQADNGRSLHAGGQR